MQTYYEVRLEFRLVHRKDDGTFIDADGVSMPGEPILLEADDYRDAVKLITILQALAKSWREQHAQKP